MRFAAQIACIASGFLWGEIALSLVGVVAGFFCEYCDPEMDT